MFDTFKRNWARRRRIREIETYINGVREGVAQGSETSGRKDSYIIFKRLTEIPRNQLTQLKQERLLQRAEQYAIFIPTDYYNSEDGPYRNLTEVGERWVKVEVEKLWRAKVEFWAKLVVPVLALILSIIALVKKSH